ncbi:MAG: hypothetical protein QNJ42_23055 [Crocosphaera sp.]|nr:hypothetical protein [Crocosphaera sp.]
MRQRLNREQKSSQREIHPSHGWLQKKSIDQDSETDGEMDTPGVYKGPGLSRNLGDKSDGSTDLPFTDYSHLKPDPSDFIRESIQKRLATPSNHVDDSQVKDEPSAPSLGEQTAAPETSIGGLETASGRGETEDGTGEDTKVSQDAVTISAENPGQILEQLKNTPPTQAFAAYTQAQSVSVQALEQQKQEVQASIPEISAPTGLPAKKTTEVGQESQQAANQAAQGNQSAVDNIEGTPSNQEKSEYDTSVVEAPPAPLPPTTQLAGQETSEEGQPDTQLSRSAQNALNSIHIDIDQISSNPGPNPKVDLSGEADPNQVTDINNQSTQEVQSTKAQAAQAIDQEFGENNIFPEASDETVKANKQLTAISPPEVKAGNAPAIPPEVTGQLNQSLSPFLTEKIGVEQDKYNAGKDKFDVDSAQAKTDANQEMANLNQETTEKQLAEQKQAKSAVAQYRQEWKTELDTVEKDYQEKAGKATTEQGKKIGEEKTKGEKEASQHLEEAEKKAKTEKQKAEREVAQKKEEGKKESGGFWGWVKSKAKALIDGIKKAVNFIYDNLRKAVKAIFEAAKRLALAAIDLARKAIVGLIKVYGEILKGLVKIAFAAFPEIAKKINAKIDQAVNKAVEVVNAAADALKKAVTAVLDFLANTLDSLLKLVQDIYNGIFTVIGMMITGEFAELFKRIGHLIDAAKAAPPQFETAGYEELLGGNLDQPLSPIELGQAQAAGINIPGHQGSTTAAPVPESALPTAPWTLENVGIDAVENNMDLSPELVADLMQQTNGDGEVMLGESSDRSRSMDSILAEVSGDKHQGGETEKQQSPDDGLTPRQRAEIKWELMKQGISQWWSDNWPMVIGAGVVGVVGFIAANIVTGGAITAALPAIMSVVGPLFVGVTIATLAGHIRDYLAKGWEGDIQGGGKSLAKGLAAGAIELISLLTFKAGGAALKGAKALAKGAKAVGKAGVKVAQGAMRAIARGAKYIIEKGKVLLKGIAGAGLGKQFKKLKDLGKGLLARMRFKAFRIRLKNSWFVLEGLINPWIKIAGGRIIKVKKGTKGTKFVTEDELKALKTGGQSKTGKLKEFESVEYKTSTTKGRGVVGDRLTGDHIPSRAALVAAEEAKLGRKLKPAELTRIRDEGVTVVLKGTTHQKLSRTYAGRNTKGQIAIDAQDLGKAFSQDAKAILDGLHAENKLTHEIVGAYLEAYRQNVRKGLFSFSSSTNQMFMDYIQLLRRS